MKNLIVFLIIFILNSVYVLANEKLPFQFAKYKYELKVPNKLHLNISGKNYIRYLKQIKLTGKKDNLNSKVINSTKKKWVNSEINTNQNDTYKIKIKIHGDWNDHISFPYSSLRVKVRKNNYFSQLKEFILFKPITRNYNSEIFATLFLQELGFLAPYTKEINLKINDNSHQKYLFQERINKNFIERSGLREGPIIEYDERHRWNTVRRDENLDKVKFANIYKLDNETFIENPDKEPVNVNKLFMVMSALSSSSKLEAYLTDQNVFFEIALSLLGACHGLIDHNRKFYFNAISEKFVPIYYDGMAFEKNLNFCENERLTKNENFFTMENLIIFEAKFLDKSFKEKIKKKFNELTIDNSKFENYWNTLEFNYSKFKEKILQVKSTKELAKEIKLNKKDYFKSLQPNYPLVYYFEDKGEYFTCFKNNNVNYKNVSLISNTGEIIDLESENFCKKVNRNKLVKILKNKIFYTPSNDKDLQIHPTFLSNHQKPFSEKVFIDISKNNEKIILEKEKIYFLYASKKEQIENLSLSSISAGNSVAIFYGELPFIKNITYDELNSSNKINKKLQKYNITGCVNFYYATGDIDNIKLTNSSCEDGINVISSKIKFKNIQIEAAVSDGIDMDFSDVKIEKILSTNSDGDCVDLSFGNYIFNDLIAKDCSDKGVSIGENSQVFMENVEIIRNNIGIAIKDSSFARIKSININKGNNTCLSLYNKKPEFSDGKLFYENINDICLSNSQLSKNSIVKKLN